MEKALYVSRSDHLSYWESHYDRLYFGTEFCERLIPPLPEISAALKFTENKKIPLSFVTTYVTEDHVQEQLAAIEYISREKPGAEVIVNDWGLFRTIRKQEVTPVLGRLLNRHMRGPRIANMVQYASTSQIEHWQRSNADVKQFQDFLKQYNVYRAELDNLLQGVKTDLLKGGMQGSLYYPYVFIATTRLCLTANCDKIGYREKVAVMPCNRECLKYGFELSNPDYPVTQELRGNTVFYRNENLPEGIEELGINRLVYQPLAPQ